MIHINRILLLYHTSRRKVNRKAQVVHAKNTVHSHALRKKNSEGTDLQCPAIGVSCKVDCTVILKTYCTRIITIIIVSWMHP